MNPFNHLSPTIRENREDFMLCHGRVRTLCDYHRLSRPQCDIETKKEADQFYNHLVDDVRGAGIPLTKDKIYGGMSNRKKPISIFKWVAVDTPVKVKEVSPSNIETADHVGKYKVELYVMKYKR